MTDMVALTLANTVCVVGSEDAGRGTLGGCEHSNQSIVSYSPERWS